MSTARRRVGVAGAVAGLGAAGVGAAVGARRVAVGRVRLRPDPDAEEPFGELRGRSLTVPTGDGLPLHVEVEGPGRADVTVVFCHGYALNQDVWHFQRRDLRGVRMVFWDQRSHGRSGRGFPTRATIEQTGDDLADVLRATVRPGKPAVLVGHSMGGMSIMAFVDRHADVFQKQVVGVALINTACGDLAEMNFGLPMVLAKLVRPLAPGVMRGLGRRPQMVERTRDIGADLAFMLTRRMAFADRQVSPTVVDFLERMIRATPIEVIAEFYPSLMAIDLAHTREVIGRVPTAVMIGGQDRLTPAGHGRALADALPATELIEVEKAGHVLPLEYPGVVTGALRRLIDKSRPTPGKRTA